MYLFHMSVCAFSINFTGMDRCTFCVRSCKECVSYFFPFVRESVCCFIGTFVTILSHSVEKKATSEKIRTYGTPCIYYSCNYSPKQLHLIYGKSASALENTYLDFVQRF